MFVRSQRLFLRPGFPEDWQELHTAIADEGIVCNLANAPWPYTPDDARGFVEIPQERLLPRFLITLPGAWGARIVGGVGLSAQGSDVELGYWVARQHWGQGLASEAASAVLRIAPMLGHRRIIASHFVDNPASGRVLRKLGFFPTGRVVERLSKGRTAPAPTVEYAISLRSPCDGDPLNTGGNDDDGMSIAA